MKTEQNNFQELQLVGGISNVKLSIQKRNFTLKPIEKE